MSQFATSPAPHKPVWVELTTHDPAGSHAFYSALFDWDIEVAQDPQYGGYAMARLAGRDAPGIGPRQSPEQPTVWAIYIGTADVDEIARKASAAAGTVAVPAFDVGDLGRMTVLQDTTGAFISAWQTRGMTGSAAEGPGTMGWAELSSRGFEKAEPFYRWR